jgi:hypothetical protein
MDDISGASRPGGSARRPKDQRRRDRMRRAGPVEAFTAEEIGHRDGWVCGICQDGTRLIDPLPVRPALCRRPLITSARCRRAGRMPACSARVVVVWSANSSLSFVAAVCPRTTCSCQVGKPEFPCLRQP